MTDAIDTNALPVPAGRKSGAMGLILGAVAAALLGGGAFLAVYTGRIGPEMFAGGGGHGAQAVAPIGDIAFLAMEPITISLPPGASARHLRFGGQLEVAAAQEAPVRELMPRILDVLNTYLRAVDVRDLEAPSAIPRLRAQMLRRIQVVTGEGRVRDLLITEFILN